MEIQEGLTLSKALYEEMDLALTEGVDTGQVDAGSVRSKARTLNKILQAANRQRSFEKARATAELDALRSEMHSELVDREANAARVAERQRFLFERHTAQPGQAAAADRASQSAAFVEAALVSLCPHTTTVSPGCAQLDDVS